LHYRHIGGNAKQNIRGNKAIYGSIFINSYNVFIGMEGKVICKVMFAKGNVTTYVVEFNNPKHYANWIESNNKKGNRIITTLNYSQENLERLT